MLYFSDFAVIIAALWFKIDVQAETKILESWIQNNKKITILVYYVKLTLYSSIIYYKWTTLMMIT